jgi:hypothetical protein
MIITQLALGMELTVGRRVGEGGEGEDGKGEEEDGRGKEVGGGREEEGKIRLHRLSLNEQVFHPLHAHV